MRCSTFSRRTFFSRRALGAVLLLGALLGGPMEGFDNPAEAARKKKADDGAATAAATAAAQEAELKKELEPLSKEIAELMTKLQSRSLFSPTDAGKLSEVRFKLFDLISKHPAQPQVAAPVYQAGLLLNQREEFHNAYELFSFLALSFPQHPYGLKAKSQMQQMEKRLGAAYFPQDPEPPKAEQAAPAPEPKK